MWGGKPRFRSPAGNPRDAFSDNELLRRGIVSDLEAPSVGPRRSGCGSSESPRLQGAKGPGARQGRPKERTAREPSKSSGLRGGQLRSLLALSALGVSASQDTLAASLSERSLLWTPGVGCLRARGINSPSPAAPDKINQPGPPPLPGPRPCWERSAWVCAWNASMCWRHGAPVSLPAYPPKAPPAEPFLPLAWRRGQSGGREWDRRAERAPGRLAGGAECWASYLQRALSPAHSRCRCCPCLRGPLALL